MFGMGLCGGLLGPGGLTTSSRWSRLVGRRGLCCLRLRVISMLRWLDRAIGREKGGEEEDSILVYIGLCESFFES